MPIKLIDLSTSPGFLVQVCAGCGTERRIAFDRGAVQTKTEPFSVPQQAELTLLVDGANTVTIALNSSADTAAGVAGSISVPALQATVFAGRVVLESAAIGDSSRVEVIGGSARKALGFRTDDLRDPCPGRPVLGVSLGDLQNPDAVCLRRCACGSNEVLNRTWDVAPPELAGTAFYEHRKAVNFLAAHFKTNAWITPGLSASIGAENAPPPDRFPEASKLISVPKI
jgi:hypothetical protein